jgi:hypothetical protein
MHTRRFPAATVVFFALSMAARAIAGGQTASGEGPRSSPGEGPRSNDDATRLRVFLTDGTTLVSYGEPARVGDRIIFSMPTASTPNPPLHLVNLPADRVDWARTDRYAASARATHYLQNQAEMDYATLSASLTETLNRVALTDDPAGRLGIVQRARQVLSEWPLTHYNYRAAEVRQMIGVLDEAIADLRAASGSNRIELMVNTFPAPLENGEPLLPEPTLRETIEQMLTAARTVDNAAERTSLLGTALTALERDKETLPADWVKATGTDVRGAIQLEQRIDRSYGTLTKSTMTLATRQARLADVRGLERLLARVVQRDQALGGRRPEAVTALVAAVQEKLDAARRLQLARDRWALREPAIAKYRVAMRTPMTLLAQIKSPLESIKSLAGSSPASLASLQRASARILKLAAAITPPDELTAAHALLVSAVQLASNAAELRRDATAAGDIDRAWNASSAAAGALMLVAQARTDIQALLRPPQLR